MSVCESNNVLHVQQQQQQQHQQQQQQQQLQPQLHQNAHKQQQQQSTQSIADYLAQLLKDRKQLAAFPNVFNHVERLLDEEISRVRASLFQINGVKKEPLELPEPEGPTVTLNEKVYVPVREHPDFNFVGRILGPRGMTAKQLEQETGCKIMVRGKGSMRDKKKEDTNRGKPNWEHLSDELHVLITVEDTENRAKIKLTQAVAEVQKLLVPQAEGEDELKKRQLMELAIINGTYRDTTTAKNAAQVCEEEWRRVVAAASADNRLLTPALPGLAPQIRAPTAAPLGAPLILSQRMTVPTTAAASILSATPAPTPFDNPAHGMIFAPYGDYTNFAALTGNPLLTEYADHSDYLRHKECFTYIQNDWMHCTKTFQSALVDEMYQEITNISHKFMEFCCARQAYEICIYNSAHYKCYKDSAIFVRDTIKLLTDEQVFTDCKQYEDAICMAVLSSHHVYPHLYLLWFVINVWRIHLTLWQ